MARRNPAYNKEGAHIYLVRSVYIFVAIILVLSTWNPFGYSYARWMSYIISNGASDTHKVIFGVTSLVLLVLWVGSLLALKRNISASIFLVGVGALIGFSLGVWYLFNPGLAEFIQIMSWGALGMFSVLIGIAIAHKENQNYYRRRWSRR